MGFFKKISLHIFFNKLIKVLLLEVMSSKGFHPAIIHSSLEMTLQCQAIKQSNKRLKIGKSKLYLEFATKTRTPTKNSPMPKSFSQCNLQKQNYWTSILHAQVFT